MHHCIVASETIDLGPLSKKSNNLNLKPSKSIDYLVDFRPIGFDCECELKSRAKEHQTCAGFIIHRRGEEISIFYEAKDGTWGGGESSSSLFV
jgi:hypothetical protein